jgi:hypothetical protein
MKINSLKNKINSDIIYLLLSIIIFLIICFLIILTYSMSIYQYPWSEDIKTIDSDMILFLCFTSIIGCSLTITALFISFKKIKKYKQMKILLIFLEVILFLMFFYKFIEVIPFYEG